MFIYFNGFWSGFFDCTNAVNKRFFLTLLEKVYDCPCEIGTFENSDILMENTQANPFYRDKKTWKHTYLFSGESYIHSDYHLYDVVLYGKKSFKNVVNIPLFIPYLHSAYPEHCINSMNTRVDIPQKDVLVLISNPNGGARNGFLEALEKHVSITYAGNYKNNTNGPLQYYYSSDEFRDYVRQFKYIVSMENSEEETYITEKIIHSYFAQTIPIYWGSKHVCNYINQERILQYTNDNMNELIQTIKTMTGEDWLTRVNKPFFTPFTKWYMNFITTQIKSLLNKKYTIYPSLTHTFLLCNKEFEPERYELLTKTMKQFGLQEFEYTFISDTYKHTITDNIYNKHVSEDLMTRIRHLPVKRSELSLTLNFKELFDSIYNVYSDGFFLTFESDIYLLDTFSNIKKCLDILQEYNHNWSCIHLGGFEDPCKSVGYCDVKLPYRLHAPDNIKPFANNEFYTNDTERRFLRKFHPRCTDSFIWSYNGIKHIKEYMEKETNYGVAFDYYFAQFLETNIDFYFYWATETYFHQSSLLNKNTSTIQNDTI